MRLATPAAVAVGEEQRRCARLVAQPTTEAMAFESSHVPLLLLRGRTTTAQSGASRVATADIVRLPRYSLPAYSLTLVTSVYAPSLSWKL